MDPYTSSDPGLNTGTEHSPASLHEQHLQQLHQSIQQQQQQLHNQLTSGTSSIQDLIGMLPQTASLSTPISSPSPGPPSHTQYKSEPSHYKPDVPQYKSETPQYKPDGPPLPYKQDLPPAHTLSSKFEVHLCIPIFLSSTLINFIFSFKQI